MLTLAGVKGKHGTVVLRSRDGAPERPVAAPNALALSYISFPRSQPFSFERSPPSVALSIALHYGMTESTGVVASFHLKRLLE